MEVDSVPERPSAEKVDGDSGILSAAEIIAETNGSAPAGNTDGNSSAENLVGESSVEETNEDAAGTKIPASPLRAAFIAGDVDASNEACRAAVEAEKADRAAQVGEFKVPRFSRRNPPPPSEPESSPNFKVPPAPAEVFHKLEPGRADPPIRQIPKRKDIILPPLPREVPESSELESLVSNVSERNLAGSISGRYEGSRNSIAVASTLASEGATSLTAVEPRATVVTPVEERSAAASCADSERLNGNSCTTDLASASESGTAPTGQPGADVSSSSQSTLAAVDRVVTMGPPYVKPSWSAAPGHAFKMEVLKEGISLGVEDVSEKGAYMFGRSDRCDFVLEHPTISRFHAVLQYSGKGKAFIFDLGSTHGTFINKRQVQGKTYVPLNVGDIVRFGHSTRLHHFQGPTEFMPEEGLSKAERHAIRMLELAQNSAEREQSLLRARRNAASADGATWGMQEDAVEEEEEEDTEEITWKNFKGELTEKQQKTLEKVHKRQEKLANLKKENDAIQAKEISQGGLTQGQQTQIARNEQRMAQLLEELENMEETLNESIREAIIGRSGVRRAGKKSSVQNEDVDDDLSDDEFYDRTSKLRERRKKKEASQLVETAETLLEKKSSLGKEIESVRLLMKGEEEQSKQKEVVKKDAESVDPLDKFMTTISTSIDQDRTARLQKELDSLNKELQRVERLLKIADPTGDALRKWKLNQTPESLTATADLAHKIDKRIFPRKEDAKELASSTGAENDAATNIAQQVQTSAAEGDGKKTVDLRPLDPPIRLGAPIAKEISEERAADPYGRESESAAGFINYKDRKNNTDEISKGRSTSKRAASVINETREEETTSADKDVASSVALLLKHKRGLAESETEAHETTADASESSQQPLKKKKKKKKKIYGPAKPSYIANAEEEESWVPPSGQTGDGRTALNDKYGY